MLSENFSDFWQSDQYNFTSSATFPFCCALWYNNGAVLPAIAWIWESAPRAVSAALQSPIAQ